MAKRSLWFVTALVVAGLMAPQPAVAHPQTQVGVPSSFYEKAGPNSVTVRQGGPDHTLYYPTDLGGTRHPVLIWGNGTGATPEPYDFALRHLASWGSWWRRPTPPSPAPGPKCLPVPGS